MLKRRPLAICLLAVLLGNAAVARADPATQERQSLSGSPSLLSKAIEGYLQQRRLARATSGRPWDVSQGSTKTHLAKCHSKRKGMLIGAVLGAAAGAATAVYVARQVGGVLGASNGATKYITYWTIGGAGAGALGGLAYCR